MRGLVHLLCIGIVLLPLIGGNAWAQVNSEIKHSVTQASFLETLEDDDQFGNSVANIGDLNGDGTDDIAVGAWHDGFGGLYSGVVWILFLDTDGTVKYRQMIGENRGGFDVTLDTADVFGYSVAGLGDIDGDGVEDIAVGSPTDDDGGTSRGAVYILFLRTDGTVKSYQKISDTEGGFTGGLLDESWFGYSITSIPDLDGNTVDDLVVGAAWDDDGGNETGAVWVLFLDSAGLVIDQQKISPLAGGLSAVLHDGDYFGSSVATIGDLDDDLVPDIVVGAENADDGGDGFDHNAGAVHVLFLNTDGTVKAEQKISDTAGGFTGELGSVDVFGCAVAALGDYDNDGVEDIVVGAHSWSGSETGSIWVLFLNDDGTVKGHQEIGYLVGGMGDILNATDHFGSGIAVVSDLDGDTVDDLIVGTERDNDGGTDRGAAWVLFMDPAGTTSSQQKISDSSGGFNQILKPDDNFGAEMTAIGDLNGDGVTDVAVGAPGDQEYRGAVWILFMRSDGSVAWHQKIGNNAGAFGGVIRQLDQFGYSVDALGDLDFDGTEDIVVGALSADGLIPGSNQGTVWILFLNPDGTVKSYQEIGDGIGGFESGLDLDDNFGYSVAYLGDFDDGDELFELAVGAINDDDGGTSRGAVWILSIFSDGWCHSAQKISSLEGNFGGTLDDNDYFGHSITPIGDLDNDGVADVAVGAIGDDDGGVPPDADRGAVWILFLEADRTVKSYAKISDTAGYFWGRLDNNDAFGYSVESLGDLDGDGVEDLGVGAPNDDDGGLDRGALWILFLDDWNGAAVKTHVKISSDRGGFTGPLQSEDWLGTGLTSLGDLNSDDSPDVLVGAQGTDDGGSGVGAGWVLFLDPADPDGDGVYYNWDQCPTEDASYFDFDKEGCRDIYHGGRHVEYWDSATTVVYYIELDAAPNITDGSDFTALQEAMSTWPSLPGGELPVVYAGTTDIEEALPLDGMNLITFKDPVMNKDTGQLFSNAVLAVGIATSFIEPTFHDGKFYRPGEIADADMLFNPAKNYKTATAGSDNDLKSIAVHEAGHLYGLSHSAVHSSTMFPVLLGGEAAQTPETEDSLFFIKCYPDHMSFQNVIHGTVSHGSTGDPIPNAAVFAIDVATGDTVAHDVTTDMGEYVLPGVVDGLYYVSIHPLD
ncbi:MAG: FG-GAP repeat protein, partial [Candidatus Latescibacterota bacterium]